MISTIIQEIDVEWSKKSRGAPESIVRNAVPETYSFGKSKLEKGVYVQKIRYSEYDNFSVPTVKPIKKINENQIRQMKLELIERETTLEIFSWGIPLRNDYPRAKLVAELNPNTWMRIVGNARIAWEHTWAYHKYVYNIYYGNSQEFDDFLKQKRPSTIYRDEIALW